MTDDDVTRERIRASALRRQVLGRNVGAYDIARSLKLPTDVVRAYLDDMNIGEAPRAPRMEARQDPVQPTQEVPQRKAKDIKKRTLGEFQAEHDFAYIINRTLSEVFPNGDDGYLLDHEMREVCNVPTNRWRRESDQFKDWQFQLQGKRYWANPSTIQKMKKITGRAI